MLWVAVAGWPKPAVIVALLIGGFLVLGIGILLLAGSFLTSSGPGEAIVAAVAIIVGVACVATGWAWSRRPRASQGLPPPPSG